MEKLETTLIKHTKYIYEYTNILSDESLDRIRNTLIHECIEKNEDYQKISIEFEVYDIEKMNILKNDLIKIQGVDSIDF